MNSLYDSLYDVCSKIKSAKELRHALEQNYESEDVEKKKFLLVNCESPVLT